MTRKTKLLSSDELEPLLLKAVVDGSMLAIGGTTIHMNPMGLLRALIRAALKDTLSGGSKKIAGLDVVAGPLAGPAVDLLCGSGLAAIVRAAYVAAEYLGLCPNYMRTVTSGDVKVWECGETILLQGLQAAAEGRMFGSTLEGLGTDILNLNPDLRQFDDPLNHRAMVAVPPIAPNVCFLHVPKTDIYGNCCHNGPVYSDLLMASATKRNNGVVIVSSEEISAPAEKGCLGEQAARVTLPGSLVDHVVELSKGAHPTSCHGVYTYDEDAIRSYLSSGKTEESFRIWLKEEMLESEVVDSAERSEQNYLIGGRASTVSIQDRTGQLETTHEAGESHYSGAELLAVRLSECIGDGELGSAGANSPIPQAAMRLAQLTHSPNMSYISSFSGYLCRFRPIDNSGELGGEGHELSELREKLFWSSFDYRNLTAAECALASTEVFWLKLDFFFVGGLQFDRCGNINLIGIGKPDAWKIRGPGSAGLGLVSATASNLFLYSAVHERRTIIDQVDFVSGIGHPDERKRRKELGLPGNGPSLLMTPLCTFDFNQKGYIRLKSLNHGVTIEEVLERTGTEVDIPESGVSVAPAPTGEQLVLLRRLIDPDGILRTLKTS